LVLETATVWEARCPGRCVEVNVCGETDKVAAAGAPRVSLERSANRLPVHDGQGSVVSGGRQIRSIGSDGYALAWCGGRDAVSQFPPESGRRDNCIVESPSAVRT